MYCIWCGYENKPGAKYCIYCGEKLEAEGYEGEIERLERRYQSLLKQAKQFDAVVELTGEIESLGKSIDKILKEAESQETETENLNQTAETEGFCGDIEREIQYCPYCGFYVGNHAFCGRCGKKIGRWNCEK